MSILVWWVVPVVVALLTGAVVTRRGRRPRIRGAFEEVEYFHRYLHALERQDGGRASQGRRLTA